MAETIGAINCSIITCCDSSLIQQIDRLLRWCHKSKH